MAVDLQHILSQTSDIWDELSGQRLFITGGTGFVGCWLLESFVHARDVLGTAAEAVVLTRRPDIFKRKAPNLAGHPGIRLIEGDVRTFRFPQDQCAYVIHAASDVVRCETPDQARAVIDTAIDGTRRVLEYAGRTGATKLLFVSSGSVYGPQPSSVVRMAEDHTGAPSLLRTSSAYGEAKRLSELLCVVEGQRSGFEVKIARAFTFVGPYLALDRFFAIGNFIRDVLNARSVRVKGDGTTRRSYLYAADLAIWLWTILCRGVPERAYNVGSSAGMSLAEVAGLVACAGGVERPVIVEQQTRADNSLDQYVPDTLRAQQELGLRERIDLPEAIARTLAWHRQVADLGVTAQ